MPESTTLDHAAISQGLPKPVEPLVDSQVVDPQDFFESKEVLKVPPRKFQEAESITHGMFLYKAREIMPHIPKNGEPINRDKLPEWAKQLDDETLENTFSSLSYLHGIRNLPEKVFDDAERQNIEARDEKFDMCVMYNTDTDEVALSLDDTQKDEDGNTRLRLTSIKSRQGDKITFGTDLTQYDITLTKDEFTQLFSYARREDLMHTLEGKPQEVASQYFDSINHPENFNMDDQTMKEAVLNSGKISTDSLIRSLQGKESSDGLDPEAQKQVEARNKNREALIKKLENHTIATAQDVADVMSFHTPAEIQKTIADYTQSINNQLDTLGQLRNQRLMAQEQNDQEQLTKIDEQMKIAQNEINSLRDKINMQTKAEQFFKDPKNLVDFFSKLDDGIISPETGKKINELIAHGDMPQALLEMANSTLEAMDEETKEKIREKLGMPRGAEITLAAIGGTALLFLMLMLTSMNQQ